MSLRYAVVVVALLASGCATVTPKVSPDDWTARRAALQSLDRWTLDGRIAVAAGEDGFSGGFDWAQQGASADIELSGPMGGTLMDIRVEGDKSVVSVNGRTYVDAEARQFIADHFGPGRSLPIEEMRYWLVGAPAPGSAYREAMGEGGLLSGLEQSGWTVRYDRHRAVGDLALPERIEMTTEGLRLRVVVSDWRLPP